MLSQLEEVSCARLPAASLAGLAPLRVHAGIRVRLFGDHAWLWWRAGDEFVLQHVMALHGVQLFARRDGRWYRPEQHLPAFEVPKDEDTRPLLHVLTPAPLRPESGLPAFLPLTPRLIRDSRVRAASALCCALVDLAEWAEQATSKQLAVLTALRAGERVLMHGSRLPALTAAERYWGRTILTPLGFQTEPEASEGVLREALRLRDAEIALLGENGFEAIDGRLFQPLTRASVRLALRERR
jgi:hypothetical protein